MWELKEMKISSKRYNKELTQLFGDLDALLFVELDWLC